MVAIFATSFNLQIFAQEAKPSALSSLLTSYYGLKNSLVASNSSEAAANSAAFVKLLTTVDMKELPPSAMEVFMPLQEKMAFDARHIAESKDIAHQREHFANFSANFFKLAKAVKLTDQPVYYDYCPMKKAYWLSAEEVIKNPYFGSQMLTCGKVNETLNK